MISMLLRGSGKIGGRSRTRTYDPLIKSWLPAVAITAGVDATKTDRLRCWSVAKSLLISGVDACLHDGSLRFADELREREALREELQNFRRHVTNAGRATYQARTGAHDDLVLAVAISLWWCGERRKRQIWINGRTPEEMRAHLARVSAAARVPRQADATRPV